MENNDKILIIDDEEIIRQSLAAILEKSGYTCSMAESAKQGKALLLEQEYDLVLTDLRLKDGNGLEIIEFVKSTVPNTLVILLTGFASVESAIGALRRGAYDYLIKPCNVDDLIHTVKRSLEKRKQGLENTRLHVELERAYFLTIKALAAAVDAKDQYTFGHSDRVMQYSVSMGKSFQIETREFDAKKLNSLRYAALIHDIGKIGIEDKILKKEGKLTPQEYSIVKLHPTLGYEIIKDVTYLDEVKLYLRHHHEWYNGMGYPDGLKGEDIPLGAQIIGVADAYDAMTSDRPYRKSLSHKEAVTELVRYSGQQFGPRVVNTFIKTFPNALNVVPGSDLGFEYTNFVANPN